MVNRAVQAVESSNAEVTGLIAAPRTWATLGGLTDTTGQALRTPEYVAGIKRYSTNNVPTNLTTGTSTTSSLLFAGDWRRMVIGVRNGLNIKVIRDSSRYVDTLETVIVAHVRADIALEQPSAFAVEKGVK